jgi:hypothetical protein
MPNNALHRRARTHAPERGRFSVTEEVLRMFAYIDQIIMFCVGVWATGVGYGFVPALGKDAAAQEQWKARFGKLFKIAGPLLIVIALALVVAQLSGVQGSNT